MSLSFQLYSARNTSPWEDVLATLAGIGYEQVEGFAANYEQPQAFRKALDKHGLSMPTGHFGIDKLEQELDSVFSTASTLGITKIICPFLMPELRPGDAAGWRTVAKRLHTINRQVRASGFSFAWHNHDFEFFNCEDDDSTPMAILLDEVPEMEWEADIAWIAQANSEPLQWVERYGSRISVAHVKDIAPAGACEDEDGWADFGHGVMDWPAIYNALRAAGTELFIAEHDNPNDLTRFASRAYQTYQSLSDS